MATEEIDVAAAIAGATQSFVKKLRKDVDKQIRKVALRQRRRRPSFRTATETRSRSSEDGGVG